MYVFKNVYVFSTPGNPHSSVESIAIFIKHSELCWTMFHFCAVKLSFKQYIDPNVSSSLRCLLNISSSSIERLNHLVIYRNRLVILQSLMLKRMFTRFSAFHLPSLFSLCSFCFQGCAGSSWCYYGLTTLHASLGSNLAENCKDLNLSGPSLPVLLYSL